MSMSLLVRVWISSSPSGMALLQRADEPLYQVTFQARVLGAIGLDQALVDLTHDTVVGCGWAGVSFRCYCGVGGLVVGH